MIRKIASNAETETEERGRSVDGEGRTEKGTREQKKKQKKNEIETMSVEQRTNAGKRKPAYEVDALQSRKACKGENKTAAEEKGSSVMTGTGRVSLPNESSQPKALNEKGDDGKRSERDGPSGSWSGVVNAPLGPTTCASPQSPSLGTGENNGGTETECGQGPGRVANGSRAPDTQMGRRVANDSDDIVAPHQPAAANSNFRVSSEGRTSPRGSPEGPTVVQGATSRNHTSPPPSSLVIDKRETAGGRANESKNPDEPPDKKPRI